jgi:catechol-2,3-dioxygenase
VSFVRFVVLRCLHSGNSHDCGSAPPPGRTGLYHLAIRYPTRAALADALRRLTAAGIRLDGASDHGVSEALYLRDSPTSR